MDRLLVIIFLTGLGLPSFAEVKEVNARVANSLPNLQIAPFGSIVNVENGEVLYVRGLISVLAPNQLRQDCIYKFHFVLDESVKYKAIRLVPPLDIVSCGSKLPTGKQ